MMITSRYFMGQYWWQWGCWLIALGGILTWWWLPEAWASTIFMPLWVGVTQIIFAGSMETAKLKRRAWLGQYLKHGSPWYCRLSGGPVMVIWHQLISVTLALILLISIRQLTVTDGVLLLITVVAFIAFSHRLQDSLERHVIADYLSVMTRRLLVPSIASILTLGLVLVSLWRPQPYLVNASWESAITDHLVAGAGETLLGAFERMGSALEISRLWAMQNAVEILEINGSVAVLGWAIMLLMQGTLAWSFLKLLAGVDALRDRLGDVGRYRSIHQNYRN